MGADSDRTVTGHRPVIASRHPLGHPVTVCTTLPVTRPLPSEFFGSLRGLPVLRDLNLNEYLPDTGFSPPLLLPALTTLGAIDSWARVSDFLDAIQVPNINYIDITLSDPMHLGDIVESCIRKLKVTVQDALKGRPGLSKFSMSGFDDFNAPMLLMEWDPASTESEAEDSEDEKPGLVEVFLYLQKVGSISLPNTLASLNTHFDLSTISTLSLETSDTVEPNIFVDVFTKLPNVEKLTLTSCSILPLLEIMEADPSLSQKKKLGKGTKVIPPYFPALLTLVFNGIDFQETTRGNDTVDLLAKVVKKRPKSHQLKSLDIRLCRNFGADDYERLKDALRNVDFEWDEEEDWTDNSDSDDFDEF